MNAKTTAIALAALLVGLAGCVDLEETPVSGVTQEYFETPEGADAAITGTYARLRDYYGQEQEIRMGMAGTDAWKHGIEVLTAAGFDYVTVNPMAAGLSWPDGHLAALEEIATETGS